MGRWTYIRPGARSVNAQGRYILTARKHSSSPARLAAGERDDRSQPDSADCPSLYWLCHRAVSEVLAQIGQERGIHHHKWAPKAAARDHSEGSYPVVGLGIMSEPIVP